MKKPLILLLVFLGLAGQCLAQTYHLDVNAGSSPGNISPLFGHNIAWVSEGNQLWDTTNWRVKPGALPLIQQVAAKKPGFTRFPGGNQADTYRWRRGVGPTDPPANPNDPYEYSLSNTRPLSEVPWNPDGERNTFGTDEFIAFLNEVSQACPVVVPSPIRPHRS